MAKSLIPLIVEELGLEEGDVFTLIGDDEREYRFSNGFLEMSPGCIDGDWFCADDATFVELVIGNYEIDEVIKPPFEPTNGEEYWTYTFERFSIIKTHWHDTAIDYACKFAGIIFRTGSEALIARPAKYKELTGKEWEDWK